MNSLSEEIYSSLFNRILHGKVQYSMPIALKYAFKEYIKRIFLESKTTIRDPELFFFLEKESIFSLDHSSSFTINPFRTKVYNSITQNYLPDEYNKPLKFNTVFQYLNFHKAFLSGNWTLIESILTKKQEEELEIEFSDKDLSLWSTYSCTFLEQGIRENINQNLDLKTKLEETRGKAIIYMNENDCNYGVNLVSKPEKYRALKLEFEGENLLGITLTFARLKNNLE